MQHSCKICTYILCIVHTYMHIYVMYSRLKICDDALHFPSLCRLNFPQQIALSRHLLVGAGMYKSKGKEVIYVLIYVFAAKTLSCNRWDQVEKLSRRQLHFLHFSRSNLVVNYISATEVLTY